VILYFLDPYLTGFYVEKCLYSFGAPSSNAFCHAICNHPVMQGTQQTKSTGGRIGWAKYTMEAMKRPAEGVSLNYLEPL